MAERATIFQTVQLGVETTPGTGVAANRKLTGINFEMGPKVDVKKYRALGQKFAALTVPTKEWMAAKLSGPITYTEIVHLLASGLAYAAPAQQGVTTAYKWTLSPDTDGPDTRKTFTVEQGSSVRAHKFANGLITGLELAFSRDGCEISGDMIGAALQDNITMTNSPTTVELVPVLPTQIDLYLEDVQADLDAATALLRPLRVSWKFADRDAGVYPLATAAGTSFATTVEKEPGNEIKLLMAADAEGMALLTTLRNGAKKFLRIKAVGANIASTYDYTLQIDTCVEVAAVSEFKDEDGVYAIEWTFAWIHDATWGKATEVQIINELTAL